MLPLLERGYSESRKDVRFYIQSYIRCNAKCTNNRRDGVEMRVVLLLEGALHAAT